MRGASWILGLGAASGVTLLMGCHSSKRAERTSPTMSFASFDQQAAEGALVFGNRCAGCHGDAGQGTDRAPALVGSGALPRSPRPGSERTMEFRTAMDVARFVTSNMPPNESMRARMTERDYWAVLAFDLKANGVSQTQPVGPQNASAIVLHP